LSHYFIIRLISDVSNQGARLRERNEKRDAGEGASESSSESEEIDEELGFFSPLDNIDPYITFQQALTGEIAFVQCVSLFIMLTHAICSG
jgi:hypothetical protein